MNDKLVIGGHEFDSRFILGSGKYDVELIQAAVEQAGAEMITLSVRRANILSTCSQIIMRLYVQQRFWQMKDLS